jgi:hypothetical protein
VIYEIATIGIAVAALFFAARSLNIANLAYVSGPVGVRITSPDPGAELKGVKGELLLEAVVTGGPFDAYRVSLDNAPISTKLPVRIDLSDVSDGAHEVVVEALFEKAAVDADSVDFIIDRTEPIVRVLGIRDGQALNGIVPFSVAIEDDSSDTTWRALVDNYIDCSFGVIATDDLSEGKHLLEIQAHDLAGNEANLVITFAVDRSPPVIGSLRFLEGVPRRGIIEFLVDVQDTSDTILSIFVDKKEIANTAEVSWDTTAVSDGQHSIVILAVDAVGLETDAVANITIDNTPPAAVWTVPRGDCRQYSQALTFRVYSIEPGTTIEYYIDGNQTSDPRLILKDRDDSRLIEAIVRDEAGNERRFSSWVRSGDRSSAWANDALSDLRCLWAPVAAYSARAVCALAREETVLLWEAPFFSTPGYFRQQRWGFASQSGLSAFASIRSLHISLVELPTLATFMLPASWSIQFPILGFYENEDETMVYSVLAAIEVGRALTSIHPSESTMADEASKEWQGMDRTTVTWIMPCIRLDSAAKSRSGSSGWLQIAVGITVGLRLANTTVEQLIQWEDNDDAPNKEAPRSPPYRWESPLILLDSQWSLTPFLGIHIGLTSIFRILADLITAPAKQPLLKTDRLEANNWCFVP